MIKKIIICTIFALLSACGFTPMLKDFDSSNLNIQKVNYAGNNNLIYLAKNYLNLKEKKEQEGLIVSFAISESSTTTAQNISGIAIEEQITLNITINVLNDKNVNLLTDSVSASRKLPVSNNLSSDQETRRIEKNNLMQNLTQKIKFKLQLISRQQK
jgi:LPS-assembly lipoprotein